MISILDLARKDSWGTRAHSVARTLAKLGFWVALARSVSRARRLYASMSEITGTTEVPSP